MSIEDYRDEEAPRPEATPDPPSFPRFAWTTMRESMAAHGWVNGTLYVLSRALARASRGRCALFKYYFVAQPVPGQPKAVSRQPGLLKVYRVSGSESIVGRFPRPPEIIARRFADGATCFVAERNGVLAGFIWLKLDRYEEDEVRCDYLVDSRRGIGWDFDAWVAPEFRMTRTFIHLWEAANDYLRSHGCGWSASRISAFNPVSLASHRRMGAVRLHAGIFLILGSAQLALFSRRPYIHFGAGERNRPELVFRPPSEARSASRP